MIETFSGLPRWDEKDLVALLTLDPVGPGRYRNRYGDRNRHGRSYGGQILGQAMMAAAASVPADRHAGMMQLVFLQGALPDQPIDFEVVALQDGKRFSSRLIRGVQCSGRQVLTAQVTFAVPMPAPEHAAPTRAAGLLPDQLPERSGERWPWEDDLDRLGGYALSGKACFDFRVPNADRQIAPETAQPRLEFWLKSLQALPPDRAVHAAAFAYLSDWWVNYCCLAAHVKHLGPDHALYVSSLNHSIWWHRPVLADQWLHFDCESPAAARGRGLSVARIHDLDGRLVASATQECLMAFANPTVE